MVTQHKPEHVFLPGDITHRQHAIRFRLYNPLIDRIRRLAESVRSVVIVLGNHDIEGPGVHSLHPFSAIPNVVVVDEGPRVVEPGFTAVPYDEDPQRVASWIEEAEARPLVAHYGAEGAPLETDYWLDAPLKLAALKRLPLVVFGHIHKPSAQCAHCGTPITDQELSDPCINCRQTSGRIIYEGALMHFDFGDSGPRSALLLDLDANTRTRLPIQAPRFVTATWPRVPVEAEAGYLRILNVPRGEVDAVKRTFLDAGWLDVVSVPAELEARVKAVAAQGLAVRDTTVSDYVRQQPDLTPETQAALVADGQRWLGEASRG